LLRVTVAITAIAQGAIYLANSGLANSGYRLNLDWIVGSLAVASGALVLVGFLTPFTSALAGICFLAAPLSSLASITPSFLDANPAELFAITMAVALVCLGPGAYSLDSRRFGRREIVIPRNSRQTQI
jgi:uncharacterized membrane protein YphA (DoxX/SURF4 family)